MTAKGRARRCGDGELLVGKATHFYSRIGVAVLKLDAPLRKGDRIHILVQTPLPPHLDESEAFASIDPSKDVDCCHPLNVGRLVEGDAPLLPCTPGGIQRLLLDSGYALAGKHVVICGRESSTARLLAQVLVQKRPDANATVTVCDRTADGLPSVTREADIIVTVLGEPECVTGDMVGCGAVVVDASNNAVPDPKAPRGYRIVGDLHLPSVSAKAEAVGPAQGGVGPMTIAMVLANTLALAQRAALD
ncbi:MAG: bifunctional 5,10-methylenetetrahydrofolate dehydrogenase/5,10-methenyltetrahydrofolate cyclohydrolase [Chloroflexota bacterium]|nr:bifunctional 5,10-methylenetetrahydrofolate dehydrogenase/5,10-methenyltetrahydrofolate cyclohydrolase [Chloroflexota bacterium]